ncbi:membrane peptidoglycan carboxypeptidase [Actinocorallia herbida]|uniref:Membrane peptidoglycan carboxypeptidase n=1 Tax=Actinocorallia herbida TaxID=58109 RepID=A0A3N1DB26_9ACTN|nr:transglycosylase domain-containing protein [Actinocorallia herbida]ROO90737.1 membrane peptidoglycan carboxypeptidase [Actinocorallia herbida]
MSNPPYGSGGPSGDLPEDDWFRPAPPQGREQIYRESQYGNSAPPTQYGAYDEYGDQSGFADQNGYVPAQQGYDDHTSFDAAGGQAFGQQYDGQGYGDQGYGDHYADQTYADQSYAAHQNGYEAHDGYGADPAVTVLDGGPIQVDNPPGVDVGDDGGRGGGGRGRGRRGKGGGGKEGWKKYVPNWKIVAAVCAVGLVAMLGLVGIGYASTPTPDLTNSANLQEGVDFQRTSVYWDGKKGKEKVMFSMAANREDVELAAVPVHVRQAVMAAEQRGFETDPGISIKGMTRAAMKTVTGGSVEGGSTITQQLARNRLNTLSTDRSVTRKVKEIFTALKLEGKYSKDEIMKNYLNTIPFGRNASGIQAASKAYFWKDISKLSVEEGAMLAAMIQQPGYFCGWDDPKKEDLPCHTALVDRWNYVLNGMVTEGWLEKGKRDAMKFPKVKENAAPQSDSQQAYILDRVLSELGQIPDFDETAVTTSGGYKIYTSLNPKLMDYAEEAVKKAGPDATLSKKNEKIIRSGLVVVDPKDGSIVAFYGGNPKRNMPNAALVDQPQIGSSFKPYVLATALSEGFNVKSLIEGRGLICLDKTTGDVIADAKSETVCQDQRGGYWMRSAHSEGQAITLVKATEQSINSSFVKLGIKVGLDKVIAKAKDFGLPTEGMDPANPSLSLGVSNVPAMYQAAGYAAFSNGGTAYTPHLITKITHKDSGTGKESEVPLPWKKKQVLTEDQAAQATEAMRAVVTSGTGKEARLVNGQPAAGKTGTTDEGAATWFVGYTPQYSAAATVYHQKSKSMEPYIGESASYGGHYPALIWKAFMDKALAGSDLEQFPTPTYTGDTMKWDTLKPKPTKTDKCGPIEQIMNQCENNGHGDGGGGQQDLPGCQVGQLPPACDATKPPPGTENDPPDWFCVAHADYPACATQDGGDQAHVDNDGDGVTADQDPNDYDPNVPNQQNNGQGQGNRQTAQ